MGRREWKALIRARVRDSEEAADSGEEDWERKEERGGLVVEEKGIGRRGRVKGFLRSWRRDITLRCVGRVLIGELEESNDCVMKGMQKLWMMDDACKACLRT